MVLIVILVIIFIVAVLHLSFANAEPEVKIGGLTFFISLFTIGPFFSGFISIPAYAPNSPNNTIEVVSIIVSGAIAGIAVGTYKLIKKNNSKSRR